MLLLSLVTLGALIGWILGNDPSQLTGLIGVLGISQGALEAGMVGKRKTFNPEA
jgi:hypothetical protein